MKMLFALVAAMSGLPGLCAAEWVVSGDWELLVKDGGRALSCRVDPPPRVSVAGERQEKLPVFGFNAAEIHIKTKLKKEHVIT